MSQYFMSAAVMIDNLGVKIAMTKHKYVSIEQPANAIQHSNTNEPCRDMRSPTMWYVRPAKPQISLHICTV